MNLGCLGAHSQLCLCGAPLDFLKKEWYPRNLCRRTFSFPGTQPCRIGLLATNSTCECDVWQTGHAMCAACDMCGGPSASSTLGSREIREYALNVSTPDNAGTSSSSSRSSYWPGMAALARSPPRTTLVSSCDAPRGSERKWGLDFCAAWYWFGPGCVWTVQTLYTAKQTISGD